MINQPHPAQPPAPPHGSDTVLLYGHAACPMVPPVRGLLRRSRVPYKYIDIHRDEEGRARVQDINGGNESVPTLVFPDGSTLTEPSTGMLKRKLNALGYSVPLSAQIMGNIWIILIVVGVVWALLAAIGVL